MDFAGSGVGAVGEPDRARPLACRILVISGAVHAVGQRLKALADSGHEVEWSRSGRHALGLLARWQPDLILLDQALPEMDAPTFLVALAEIAPAAHLPVLLWDGTDQA